MERLWIQSFLRWPRSKTLLVIFLCYFLPFVNCYQWKLKIPKQFSNITSLVSCMLWCIVSCIVSWHLYRDMYRLLRKCIVAALVSSVLICACVRFPRVLRLRSVGSHYRDSVYSERFCVGARPQGFAMQLLICWLQITKTIIKSPIFYISNICVWLIKCSSRHTWWFLQMAEIGMLPSVLPALD